MRYRSNGLQIYKYIIFLILTPIIFTACIVPNYKEAKSLSNGVLGYISKDQWNNLWDVTSASFREKTNYTRFLRLQMWVNMELGTISTYNMTSFYSGSSFGVVFFKSEYDIKFEHGKGTIEFVFIKENKKYKLDDIFFCKKPVY